jgi:hypothetical protein
MKGLLITIRKHRRSEMGHNPGMIGKLMRWTMALAIVAGFAVPFAHATEEGIALAIVYDTSGSMRETVPAGDGKSAPKYVIANKALTAIVNRVGQFATNVPGGARKIEAGLWIFHNESATEAVKFGAFDAPALKSWIKQFSQPNGSTPLGNSIRVASKAVLDSNLSHKHVVVVTDGKNTSGPTPERVIPGIQTASKSRGSDISFYFVAFDVDAKVFEPVKNLGATVVGASNEQQLNKQFEFIFEKKILLEDEEPAHPAVEKPQNP